MGCLPAAAAGSNVPVDSGRVRNHGMPPTHSDRRRACGALAAMAGVGVPDVSRSLRAEARDRRGDGGARPAAGHAS